MDDLSLQGVSGPRLSAADLYAALRLRAEVFVVEQACPYLDPDGRDLDSTTLHWWLRTPEGHFASYLRVLSEPGGGHRIGRVITHPDHRGQRLAGRLIAAALTDCAPPVVLHAQSHLVEMYARHGFVPHGAEYLEDDIAHTPMRLP